MIFKAFVAVTLGFMLSTNMTARYIFAEHLTTLADIVRPDHGGI